MADFCQQCSVEMFDMDFGDLSGLGDGKKLEPDKGWLVLCEGCGPIVVDDGGRCVSDDCLKKHGKVAPS